MNQGREAGHLRPHGQGTPKAGSLLAAQRDPWTTGTTFSYRWYRWYRWYRNGTPIPGAASSTYRATTADCGKKITVRVHGKKAFPPRSIGPPRR